MRVRPSLLPVILGLTGWAALASAQIRELDPQYATGGVAVLGGPFDGAAWAHLALPAAALALRDGRSLFAGRGADGHIVVRRLGADGRADRTFGTDGQVPLPMDRGSPGLAIDPVGRVLVAAAFSAAAQPAGAAPGASVVRVVRLLPDGRLDAAFGTGGAADRELASAPPLSVRVALDDAGRVLVAAGADDPRGTLHLWRLRTGGEPDPAYRNASAEPPREAADRADRRSFPIAIQAVADGAAFVLVEAPGDEYDDWQRLLRFDPSGAFDRKIAEPSAITTPVKGFDRLNGIRREGDAVWLYGRYRDAGTPGAMVRIPADGSANGACTLPSSYLVWGGPLPQLDPVAVVPAAYSYTVIARPVDDRQDLQGLVVFDVDDDCSPYTGSYAVYDVPPERGLAAAYIPPGDGPSALLLAGTTASGSAAAARLRYAGAAPPSPGVLAAQNRTVLVDDRFDAAQVTVRRTGGRAGAASIEVGTADGTARADANYRPVRTRLDWAAGEDGPKTVRMPLLRRPPAGSVLNFNVQLREAIGAPLAGDATVSVTIAGPVGSGLGGGSSGGGGATSPAPAPAAPSGGGGATSPADVACLLASALLALRRRQRPPVA